MIPKNKNRELTARRTCLIAGAPFKSSFFAKTNSYLYLTATAHYRPTVNLKSVTHLPKTGQGV